MRKPQVNAVGLSTCSENTDSGSQTWGHQIPSLSPGGSDRVGAEWGLISGLHKLWLVWFLRPGWEKHRLRCWRRAHPYTLTPCFCSRLWKPVLYLALRSHGGWRGMVLVLSHAPQGQNVLPEEEVVPPQAGVSQAWSAGCHFLIFTRARLHAFVHGFYVTAFTAPGQSQLWQTTGLQDHLFTLYPILL